MPKILIVEDDASIRDYLHTALTSSGYLTGAAASLSEAHEALAMEDYDILVVDAWLPDGEGLDLVAEASAHGKRAIVMSGHAASMRRMDRQGIPYLQKPFELPALIAAIRDDGHLAGKP